MVPFFSLLLLTSGINILPYQQHNLLQLSIKMVGFFYRLAVDRVILLYCTLLFILDLHCAFWAAAAAELEFVSEG